MIVLDVLLQDRARELCRARARFQSLLRTVADYCPGRFGHDTVPFIAQPLQGGGFACTGSACKDHPARLGATFRALPGIQGNPLSPGYLNINHSA